jgi:hypothetical protein
MISKLHILFFLYRSKKTVDKRSRLLLYHLELAEDTGNQILGGKQII